LPISDDVEWDWRRDELRAALDGGNVRDEISPQIADAARVMFENGIKPPYLVNGEPNHVAPDVIVGMRPGPQSFWVNERGERVDP
jgi:hypothetical protein